MEIRKVKKNDSDKGKENTKRKIIIIGNSQKRSSIHIIGVLWKENLSLLWNRRNI